MKTIQKGYTWTDKYTAKMNDGRELPIKSTISLLYDSNSDQKGIICILRDISEIRLIENNLNRSYSEHDDLQVKMREAVEAGNAGLREWNIKTDKILFSIECMQILGYGENEIIHSIDERIKLIHPDDINYVREIPEKSISEKCDYKA